VEQERFTQPVVCLFSIVLSVLFRNMASNLHLGIFKLVHIPTEKQLLIQIPTEKKLFIHIPTEKKVCIHIPTEKKLFIHEYE
jgi:hypothetical protein